MTNSILENELTSQLGPGEKLIWTGKPKTGIAFRSSDAFLIPFSLVWAGFVLFGMGEMLSMDAPMPVAFFGVLFVVVGVYITVGRFFVDARKRANTVYGITADRIIIKSGVFNAYVKSLNIRALSDITISQKADGSGTITLGQPDYRYAMMQGMDWPGTRQPPRLEFIDDVKSVYDTIISLQRQK